MDLVDRADLTLSPPEAVCLGHIAGVPQKWIEAPYCLETALLRRSWSLAVLRANRTSGRALPVRGDRLDGELRWKGAADLSGLTNDPARLRFVLKNASLYAFWVAD
jgi:hypothetical protein